MNMAKLLATLDTGGWMRDPLTIATKLMDYYKATEHSQSNEFQATTYSLAYLVQQHGNKPEDFASNMERELQSIFGSHFEMATVSVRPNKEGDENGYFGVDIDVKIQQDGENYSLGALLITSSSNVISYQIKTA